VRIRLALIALALGLVSTPSWGDDIGSCLPHHLEEGEGSMVHVPPFDQGKYGNCYAVVAAEILDAYRYARGDKHYDHRTSPFYAYVTDKSWFRPDTDMRGGGNIEVGLRALTKGYSCNQNKIFGGLDGKKLQEYLDDLEQGWGHYNAFKSSLRNLTETPNDFGLPLFKSLMEIDLACSMRRHQIPPELIEVATAYLPHAMDYERSADFLADLLNKQCEKGNLLYLPIPRTAAVPARQVREISGWTAKSYSGTP
jgi:hypothetical protein